MIIRTLLLLFGLVLSLQLLANQKNNSLVGVWAGSARYNSEATRLVLHVEQQDKKLVARISLLDIGVSGWPATKISFKGSKVRVVLPSDSGPQNLDFQLTGRRLAEQTLTGTWREQNYSEPAHLKLARSANQVGLQERRMVIKGSAGDIGASLILPAGKGPFPAVVFLHGSGPQPRDASRFAAESFARLGIASLIYDKRGVAESTGNFKEAGFDDLADDAVTAANYLQRLPSISSIGFWGHSQGGWLAPLAASKWQHSAFVITSAGPAVSPAREGEWGFVYPIKDRPDAEQVIPLVRQIVAAWHTGLRSDYWREFKSLVKQYKREDWFKQAGLRGLSIRPSWTFPKSYQRSMDYDPLTTLRKLSVPMLAIFAPDDESIDSAESMALLNDLIKAGSNIRLISYPGYSHAMRKTGLRFPNHPEDYFSSQASFIQELVSGSR